MANVNIPDLAALTAPAATDEIEVYDASAAANVRLALSYVALTGTANVFTATQTFSVGIWASAVDSDTAGIGAAIVGGGNYWAMRTDTGHNFHLDTYDGSYNSRVKLFVNGHLSLNTTTDAAQLTVKAGSTSTVGLVVDTPASPTANLAEFRNNTTAKFSIDKDGKFTSAATTAVFGSYTLTVPATGTAALLGYTNANHLIVANGYAFQGIDANAGTRTLIQEAGLGYAEATYPGVRVGETGNHIALFVNPSANSGNQFSGNINELLLPNDTRVLVENSGSTAWQSAGRILDTHWMIGTTTDSAQLTVKAGSTSTVGLVVDTAASTTANLAEFRNNGTAVSGFGPNGSMFVKDGMTAPAATSGYAKIYVDTADGDLKIVFGDGTIKTIVVDT